MNADAQNLDCVAGGARVDPGGGGYDDRIDRLAAAWRDRPA